MNEKYHIINIYPMSIIIIVSIINSYRAKVCVDYHLILTSLGVEDIC